MVQRLIGGDEKGAWGERVCVYEREEEIRRERKWRKENEEKERERWETRMRGRRQMASKRIESEDRNVPWGLLNYFSTLHTLFSLLFLYNTVSKKLSKALGNKYHLQGKVKSFRSCLNLDWNKHWICKTQPHISISTYLFCSEHLYLYTQYL